VRVQQCREPRGDQGDLLRCAKLRIVENDMRLRDVLRLIRHLARQAAARQANPNGLGCAVSCDSLPFLRHAALGRRWAVHEPVSGPTLL
jgi:hypothetical protein